MTTRERREEYSTNVVRVLHPTRPLSPGNKTDLDNNLDYLLDDLQQSISRPGSSLSQPITNYTTTRDVQYLSPSNSSTIIRERSLSPNTNAQQKMYKTTKYEYKTTKSGQQHEGGVSDLYQQNINQLDTLLSDLEREQDSTLDRKKHYSSNSGIDSGLIEPGSHVTTTTRTYRTNSNSRNQIPAARELFFESPASTASRQSRTRQRSPPYEKVIETRIIRDNSYGTDSTGIYGGINKTASPPPRALSSPSGKVEKYYTESRTMSTDRSGTPKNVHYGEDIQTSLGPTALEHIPVDGNILPRPTTKVTTTVRTYTYEIPNDGSDPTTGTLPRQKVIYKNESYNTKTNTLPSGYPERDVPSPVPTRYTSQSPVNQIEMYKNETYNTLNRYPNEPREPTTNTTIFYKKDLKESSTNFYPNQPHDQYPPMGGPRSPSSGPRSPSGTRSPPGTNSTIYKYDVTNTTNTHVLPGSPTNNGYPPYPSDQYPQQPQPVNNMYIYKEETRNTTNTRTVPPSGPPYPNDRYPNDRYPNDRYPNDHYPNDGYPGDRQPNRPNEPTTTIYKYSTVTNTQNIREQEPLIQPAPFPNDGYGPSNGDGNPPKRLDDLLASFGDNTPTQYRQRPVDETPVRPAKVAFDQTDNNGRSGRSVAAVNPNNAVVPAKNVSGPPVYYPPGHEMFAKKEESGGAAWRAQGAYARGSGKYMYESESKSKSSSKSGAAVVPVCLPLCCAMPCSIM